MPSARRSRSSQGRVPLADEIAATGPLRTRSKKRKSGDENDEENFVDTKASRKILKISQDLVAEDAVNQSATTKNSAFSFNSHLGEVTHDLREDEDDDDEWENEDGVIDEVVSLTNGHSTAFTVLIYRRTLTRRS